MTKQHMSSMRVGWLMMLVGLLGAAAASCAGAGGDPTVRIDLSRRHQTIDGFGTCMTNWRRDYDAMYATEAFQRTYAETIGLSMLRIGMPGSVLPKPIEDWHDIRYQDFAVDERPETKTYLTFARGIKAINPQIKLIGSVWSPPGWMKINGETRGERSDAIEPDSYTRDGRTFDNRLKPDMYYHFAKWLVELAKFYEAGGTPFYAISVGNEVMFTQTFGSCVWTAEDYAKAVRIVGEMLDNEGLGYIKLFGPETMTGHHWSNAVYIHAVMDDPDTAKYLDIFATHGYTDGFHTDVSKQSAIVFQKMIKPYGRRFWITEGGTGSHQWPDPLTQIGSRLHNALALGDASAVLPWLISDAEPNQHGLMVNDTLTAKTYVAIHYFRFIRPGAVRVEMTGTPEAISASAYLHDGNHTLTVVLTNPSQEDRTLTLVAAPLPGPMRQMDVYRTSATEKVKQLSPIDVREGSLTITLPAQSIVTLQGKFEASAE